MQFRLVRVYHPNIIAVGRVLNRFSTTLNRCNVLLNRFKFLFNRFNNWLIYDLLLSLKLDYIMAWCLSWGLWLQLRITHLLPYFCIWVRCIGLVSAVISFV